MTSSKTSPSTILRIDASARYEGSTTRQLADLLIDGFVDARIIRRDLAADQVPQIDEDWVHANLTPAEKRDAAKRQKLETSDALVGELEQADLLVIAAPIYNFSVPASLKAWIDQIARAGRTFRYSENGPVGLLAGKRAIVIVASGGTQIGSAIDFATPYLRHVLSFIGIDDVEFVAADGLMGNPDRLQAAREKIAGMRVMATLAA